MRKNSQIKSRMFHIVTNDGRFMVVHDIKEKTVTLLEDKDPDWHIPAEFKADTWLTVADQIRKRWPDLCEDYEEDHAPLP